MRFVTLNPAFLVVIFLCATSTHIKGIVVCVHTKHRAAFRASPIFIFGFDKILDADFFDAGQIADWTRFVLGLITLVQMDQTCARKRIAFETIFKIPHYHFFAVLDVASYTRFRFQWIVSATTWASLLISHIGPTKAAIYAARGNHG